LADGRTATELAEELKAESDRQLHLDPDQALRVADLIGELGDLADDSGVRALGELAVADALRLLGRYAEALEAYARAAARYRDSDDEVGWARSRIGAAVTWRYTGIAPDSLAEIDQARAVLIRHGLWLRVARLEQHAGILLSELGRLEEATRCYERALEAAGRLDARDPTQEARILGNLALTLQRLGEYERAEEVHAAAMDVFERHGQAQELALAQANSARLLADQSHYSRALDVATSARRGLQQLGHTVDAAFVGRAAIQCLLALNRFDEAIDLAARVATDFQAAGATVEFASTLLLHSSGLRRLGRHAEALADLDTAEQVFTASDCAGWVAVVAGDRAALLADTGAWSAAATEAELAANELARRGQVVDSAQATLVQARALQAMGDAAGARRAVDRVLTVVSGRGLPWLEYQAWRLMGALRLGEQPAAQALEAFEAAIDNLEQVQGRILTEARSSFLADKLDVYESAVGLCLEAGAVARAFDYAERAKSRALVDALAGRLDIRIRPRSDVEQRLADELTHLRRRHDQLSATATGSIAADPATGVVLPAFPGDELAECEQHIGRLLDELRLGQVADLERLSLLQGRAYPLMLDRGSCLVEYFSVGDDLCVIVGSGTDLHAERLVGARPRVERLMARVQMVLRTAAAIHDDEGPIRALEPATRGALEALHRELIAPIAALLAGAERLVIVPHGVLHHAPFAAFLNGTQYLLEQYEIVLGPSASALAFCRRPVARQARRVLVVAHSDAGALPGALAEALRVVELFDAEALLENEATRANFIERSRTASVIHLATHGHARLDAPLFSNLRLADGLLTALDCFELELDCDLVTLSACESGQSMIAPGDETIGLARALLYAGAHSVLHTLWRVDDRTTAELMDGFYTRLRAGQARAQALRAAQLDVLEGGSARTHPFFWASLVLVGDWGPLSDGLRTDGEE